MAIENKDQSAFPFVETNEPSAVSPGMTKLEFFACNAPNEIPWWFVHTPPIKSLSKRFKLEDINNDDDRKIVKDWEYDPIYDLPDHLQWYSERLDLINKEQKAYEHENNVARYFQWRRYYAEQLLLELSKPQP